MTEPVAAIVVAAGSGRRLGESAAGGAGVKALRLLGGQPLVARSVATLIDGGVTSVVVVIPEGLEREFAAALDAVTVPLRLVTGGAERQDSVRRGLAAVEAEDGIVLVHDAARPLVPADVTRRVAAAVRAGSRAVIPVIPVVDSMRRVTAAGSAVVDRSELRAVQTPQGFDLRTLRRAHAEAPTGFTDDAAVCEALGEPVVLVAGSPRSLKITLATDFAAAEALLEEEP